MLESKKSTTLNGYAKIEEKIVVRLSATIGAENNAGTVNQTIVNSELYDANKDELRKDIADFQTKVSEVQDELGAE